MICSLFRAIARYCTGLLPFLIKRPEQEGGLKDSLELLFLSRSALFRYTGSV